MMGQILFFGLFLQSDTRDSRLPLRRFKSFNKFDWAWRPLLLRFGLAFCSS